jgi:hypothetical protein
MGAAANPKDNDLISALPIEDYERWQESLEAVNLPWGTCCMNPAPS